MPYFGFEPTASDTLSVFKYVATASQTTFTGSDAGGATLSYDVGDGSCQVFLNGVRLDSGDITATNGTSVVLAACALGDIVHIQATKAFIPADVVSASSGGTFASAVSVPALTATGAATLSGGASITGTTPTLTIGDAGAEDAKIVFDGNAQDFHIGLDDTADSLAIGLGSALGTTDHMVFDATGAVTKPLQPAFSAIVGTTISNVTGDSTGYTIIFNSEEFDTNGDFDTSTGLFTAPVAGVYSFTAGVSIYGITSSHTSDDIFIKDNTDNWYGNKQNLYATATAAGYRYMTLAATFYMAASDTAGVEMRIYNGAKVVDVLGQSYPTTWFSGCLLA